MTTNHHHPSAPDGLEAISWESRTALSTLRGYVEIVQEELNERGIEMVDEFNHLEGALADLLSSIARLEEHASRAGREASIDVLTGLPNRRHLFEVGERWIRSTSSITAILLDLDKFKWVNDAHGHHVGDAVLVEFSQRLRSALRLNDVVCRLAGDEFVVLLPNATPEIAAQIAHRIERSVESKQYYVDGIEIPIAASLGVAHQSNEHNTLEDLLREADHAMYAAKRKRSECRERRGFKHSPTR